MDEEKSRELYWKSVSNLNEIIDSGEESKEDIIEELENDLNENQGE